MKNTKLVIFDMDGLTLDTERMTYEAIKETAALMNITIPEELYIKTVGLNEADTHKLYFEVFGQDAPIVEIGQKAFALKRKWIEEKGVPTKHGVVELLQWLKSKEIKIAVATSSYKEEAHHLLKKAELHSNYDYILCGDEVTRCKPDPEVYQRVAKVLGVPPEECIVLEDSPTGALAGVRAGMKVILIPDLREPDDETLSIVHSRMDSLQHVKDYLKSVLD